MTSKNHGPDFSQPVYALWRPGMKYCVCSNNPDLVRRRHPRRMRRGVDELPPICRLDPAGPRDKGRAWFGLDLSMAEYGVYGLFVEASRDALRALRAERKKLAKPNSHIIQIGEPTCLRAIPTEY